MNISSIPTISETRSSKVRIRGRLRAVLALAGIGLFLGGCATTSSFNQSYLAAARRPAEHTTSGKVLVKTSEQDDAYVFSGHPTSFTGAGTTLTLPIGEITKEASRAAFSDVFQGGADLSHDIKNLADYKVVVAPKVTGFTYEYNQLKNVGFAITPTVTTKLQVQVLDADGHAKWERSYDSGNVEGPSYMIDLGSGPGERISKLAHKAIYDLLVKAANDIRTEQVDAGSSGTVADKP